MKLLCKLSSATGICPMSLFPVPHLEKVSIRQTVFLKMFCTLGKNISDKIVSTTVAYVLPDTKWFWLKLACDVLNPQKEANHSQGNSATVHLQSF